MITINKEERAKIKGPGIAGEFSEIWPNATQEMSITVGKQVLRPFLKYSQLNACAPILDKVMKDGTPEEKAQFEAMLTEFQIDTVMENGEFIGMSLQADAISRKVLGKYEPCSTEYHLACYFTGKLQEKMASYRGPDKHDSTDLMLGIISGRIASECTVPQCMERLSEILEKGEK